ncbi:secretin N-terminal domain-containing protein [Allorhodopirellula solitaria]|nr:secretin N-terminal domain-containing protein [Allorhodopirellula solitaria]
MLQTRKKVAKRPQKWIVTVLLFAIAFNGAWLSNAVADRPDAPELRQVEVPMGMMEAIATQLSLHYHDEVGVSITADDRNGGGILVMAPPSLQDKIANQIQQLTKSLDSVAHDAGERTTINLPLKHISWREAEDVLRAIAGKEVPVTTSRSGERATFQIRLGNATSPTQVDVDRRRDLITLTTFEASQRMWQSLFTVVDQPIRFADERTEVLRLVHAEIAPVQRMIRLLEELDEKTAPQAEEQQLNRPAVMRNKPKFRTAAFAQNTADDEEIIEEQLPTPSGDVAAAVAEAAAEDTEGGVIGDTDIQIVPDSGLIIIKGAKRDVQRIKEVIAEIEAQAKITQPEIEVRQLKYADSNAVAELLQQLYEDVLSARQGDVSITSLDAPNALLLIGRAEAIKAVMDLVEKIDQPIPDSDKLRVFRLKHASALDVEENVREFFTSQPGEDSDPREGLGIRVRIKADQRTNSLIVSASPRDLTEVTRLVEELDVANTAATSQIRIFPLRNARAEDLAPVLQDSVTAEPENVPEGTTPKSSTLSIVSLGADGSSVLDSGVLSGTVVTADNNANAIVVRAPSEGMALIAELIRQLDTPAGIDSLVKVFTIENGDATQLTTALQNLFGEDAGSSGTSIGAGNQAGLASLSASESALVPLRFSTDARTNSIIASGSAEDLEVVESILLRLDSTGFAERITEVIWLKHQIADNIAAAITNYVSARQQTQNLIPQLQQSLGPYDLPDRDLVVVPEGQTNSLLLSVSPRLYEEVRRLIDRLDRRPPMVLIKTLIAEVRLDDGFEIGGELGLQDSLLFDRGIAGGGRGTPSLPGFNFNNAGLPNLNQVGRDSLASQGVTAFGVAQSALDPTNNGGFVFSAASESISLFLRTLQTANRLQILSRPQVMTTDNTEGFVTVGQSFPRPTELSTNQNSTTIGVTDVDVGIILRVTPRVGADGLIIMNIDASRSSISPNDGQVIGFFDPDGDGDGAPQPISVPAIDQTVAQSVITAYDGQTVVFGGLIQKSRTNFTRRVPYLADIPLLGYMFKYDREEEIRSELLIVMTPMLVTGDEDLEYVKQTESSKMSWCLADVVEAQGDDGLSGGYGLWGPAIGPTIYPDIQPTVDVFPPQDMPTHSAVRTGLPGYTGEMIDGDGTMPATGLPPGVELGPGESIMSPAELFQSEPYGNAPSPNHGAQGSSSPYVGDGNPVDSSEFINPNAPREGNYSTGGQAMENQTHQWTPEQSPSQRRPSRAPEVIQPNPEPNFSAPAGGVSPTESQIMSPSDSRAGASTSQSGGTPATPAAMRTAPTRLPESAATTAKPAGRWSTFQGKMGRWIAPASSSAQ